MRGAAQGLLVELRPGEPLGRVEHTQLDTGLEDAAHVHVDVRLRDQALLDSIVQGLVARTALHVGAGQDRVGGSAGGVGVRAVLALVVEVADGAAVGHHDAAEAPLVTQDLLQEPVAGAARLALIALVGAHHLLHIGLLHDGAEGREVGLPEVAHRHGSVEAVAVRLRAAVHGVVLRTGVQLEIFAVVALHALHGLDAHHGVQVRVLARRLLAAAPAGIAEDVDIRTPERQAVVPDVAVRLGHAQLVVVGGVPDGAGLIGDGRVDLQLLGRVEGGAQRDHLREHGHVVIADAVAGLIPPVVGGNVQPVHGHGTVHHQADLLLRREQGEEVVRALLHGEIRILEGIVVVLAPDGEQRDGCCAKQSFRFHRMVILVISFFGRNKYK